MWYLPLGASMGVGEGVRDARVIIMLAWFVWSSDFFATLMKYLPLVLPSRPLLLSMWFSFWYPFFFLFPSCSHNLGVILFLSSSFLLSPLTFPYEVIQETLFFFVHLIFHYFPSSTLSLLSPSLPPLPDSSTPFASTVPLLCKYTFFWGLPQPDIVPFAVSVFPVWISLLSLYSRPCPRPPLGLTIIPYFTRSSRISYFTLSFFMFSAFMPIFIIVILLRGFAWIMFSFVVFPFDFYK